MKNKKEEVNEKELVPTNNSPHNKIKRSTNLSRTSNTSRNTSNRYSGDFPVSECEDYDEIPEINQSSDETDDNKEERKGSSFLFRLIPFFFIVLALVLAVSFIFWDKADSGIFGYYVNKIFYGTFSIVAWIIPVLLINLAIFWNIDHRRATLTRKLLSTLAVLVLLSALNYYFSYIIVGKPESMSISTIWNSSQRENGFMYGGIFGAYIGWLLCTVFERVLTPIILISALVVFIVFLMNISPDTLVNTLIRALKCIGKTIRRFLRFLGRSLLKFFKFIGRKLVYAFCLLSNKIKNSSRSSKNNKSNKTYNYEVSGEFAANEGFTEDSEKDLRLTPSIRVAGGNMSESSSPYDDKASDGENDFKLSDIFQPDNTEKGPINEIGSKKSSNSDNRLPNDKPEENNVIITSENDKTNSAIMYGQDESRKQNVDVPEKITVVKTSLMSDSSSDDDFDVEAYYFPPIEFLQENPVNEEDLEYKESCKRVGQQLVDVLKSFKVGAQLVGISIGPTITRYELEPDEGVRVKSIAGLSDDIGLKLAAKRAVRIEAPILGKSAVGIEVASPKRRTVFLSELLNTDAFKNAKSKLTAAVGLDIAGEPVYMDISAMPHLLIAGTTGSGKSVCMNCIILSLLYKATPDEVKFIMIDPKEVEFSIYSGLPHLVVPVVSDFKEAAGTLRWAENEMDRRYKLIRQVGVRDIGSYNNKTKNDPEKEYLPKLVIFIDELADLMMKTKDTVETSICRIAQKGRACGMHLIIGTQRPSVDVITGLIKANVPSRIAFSVSSQIDSRTILDSSGAETLLGKGDMLYAPIQSKDSPLRVQGGFVTDSEVENIVNFIKDNNKQVMYDEDIIDEIKSEAERCVKQKQKFSLEDDYSPDVGIDKSVENGLNDPKFCEAVDIAIDAGKIATSFLQRKLGVGYPKASKLIDAMEKLGIVTESVGQRPRDVKMSKEEWEQFKLAHMSYVDEDEE